MLLVPAVLLTTSGHVRMTRPALRFLFVDIGGTEGPNLRPAGKVEFEVVMANRD